MKQFIAFVKKEFFHIFRDRRTMLILLGMPVVQIILFGFAITTEVKNVRVGVLDPSNDIVTRKNYRSSGCQRILFREVPFTFSARDGKGVSGKRDRYGTRFQ